MIDIKNLRSNLDAYRKAAKDKNLDIDFEAFVAIDERRRFLIQSEESLKAEQNQLSKSKPDESAKNKLSKIKQEIKDLSSKLIDTQKEYDSIMCKMPTIPAPDTPIGQDSQGNVEIMRHGEIPHFDFPAKDYLQLAKDLDILDTERGVETSGFRGYYIKNEGVILMLAFLFYALKKLSSKGYRPMIPPTLVKDFVLFGSGYFKGLEYDQNIDEVYQVSGSKKEEKGKQFLVGTAEPSLLAYYHDKILSEESLPIKVCGYSQCYRSEIGSYGKDLNGIYRVHEFMKIEQVVICSADLSSSEAAMSEMIKNAEELHQDLGLPYRLLRLCSGDLSAGKYKSLDIEAWMPGRGKYGETGSASNFLDWQARRLNIKYKTKDGEKKYAYLLNDTALPSPRIFIALLENHQQADGSVKIPEVLIPYTGFSVIKPKKML